MQLSIKNTELSTLLKQKVISFLLNLLYLYACLVKSVKKFVFSNHMLLFLKTISIKQGKFVHYVMKHYALEHTKVTPYKKKWQVTDNKLAL